MAITHLIVSGRKKDIGIGATILPLAYSTWSWSWIRLNYDKTNYIGRNAIAQQIKKGLKRRLVYVKPKDAVPILLHDEPIWCDDLIIGSATSGTRFAATISSKPCL